MINNQQVDTGTKRFSKMRVAGFNFGRTSDVVFVVLFLTYISVLLNLTLRQHESFHTGFDLAVYDNQVWNLSVGKLLHYSLIESVNFKDYSFDPLIVALVPLYAILPDARTLLIVATFALAVSSIPIYWFARKRLGGLLALVIVLAYFISPETQYVNLLNFHVIVLATPLLTFGLFFLFRKRYAPFLLCLFLAMLAKEEVSLIAIGFGIYLFIVQRKFKGGIALTMIGFLSLIFILGYVFPYVIGKPYFHVEGRHAFDYYGDDVWQVLTSLITRPDKIWNTISSPAKLEFLMALFLPLGLIPFVGLEVLLTSLPFLMSLLASNPNAARYQLQYPAALLPSLFFALIVGMHRIRGRLQQWSPHWLTLIPSAANGVLAILLLASSIYGYWAIAPGPFADHYDPTRYAVNADMLATRNLFSEIPPDATVHVQEELLAHFSNRKAPFTFPEIPDCRQPDFLVTEKGRFFYDFHKAWRDEWLASGYYDLFNSRGDFSVYKRKESDIPLQINFGNELTLTRYKLVPDGVLHGGMNLRSIFQWRSDSTLSNKYRVELQIQDAQGHVWAKVDCEPAEGFAPTNSWQVGKLVEGQFRMRLPPTMPAGSYTITVGIHQAGNDIFLKAYDLNSRSLGTEATIAPVRIEKNKGSFTASDMPLWGPFAGFFADMEEMRLMGYYPYRVSASAGDLVQIGLYWRARAKPQRDYSVVVQLRDSSGQLLVEQIGRPASGTYPTQNWDAGEVLLDWHDFFIPTAVTPGDYSVVVGLRDSKTDETLGMTTIGSLEILAPK